MPNSHFGKETSHFRRYMIVATWWHDQVMSKKQTWYLAENAFGSLYFYACLSYIELFFVLLWSKYLSMEVLPSVSPTIPRERKQTSLFLIHLPNGKSRRQQRRSLRTGDFWNPSILTWQNYAISIASKVIKSRSHSSLVPVHAFDSWNQGF